MDLADNIASGTGISDPHGTMVAGVAEAVTDNEEGIASLGWNTSLWNYGRDTMDTSFVAQSINEAAENVDIINMSFCTYKYDEDLIPKVCANYYEHCHPWVPASYESIESAVQNAIQRGIICVSSAGNTGINMEVMLIFPLLE